MRRPPFFVGAICALLSACTPPASEQVDVEGGLGDKADRPPAPCASSVHDFGGTRGRANDDLVTRIMGCTKTYKAAVQALSQKEPGCEAGSGFATALVSERSQLLDRDVGYRSVMNRGCGTRNGNKLWFSPLAQVTTGGDNLPEDVEVIAFDESKQAYNFYALERGVWSYHGDSFDMIAGPLADPAKRRCAACHTGGGLIMKERQFPWANWKNLTLPNPSSGEIIADVATKLGISNMRELNGAELQEEFIDAGNGVWNLSRLARLFHRLKPNDPSATRALLRPLFCTVEMNLLTAPVVGLTPIDSVPHGWLVDGVMADVAPHVPPEVYTNAIVAAGQRVVGASTSDHVVREIAFSFAVAERSGADMDYTRLLVQSSPLGFHFVRAALLADFTRPIFSGGMEGLAPGRCELLDLAPGVEAGTPEEVMPRIRDGFIAALTAKPSLSAIEATFLAALQSPNNFVGADEMSVFQLACEARAEADPVGFVRDLVRIASVNRRLANKLPIVEDPTFLFPTDDLDENLELRLDPTTCVAH